MAKRTPKISLVSTRSGGCETVRLLKPGSRTPTPIGSVCQAPGGWDFSSMPTLSPRGPVKHKATAILKVVNDYRAWIGWSATDYHGLGKAKRRRPKARR